MIHPVSDGVGTHKYCNVFRVLDYGSQFLLRLIDPDPYETMMRCFLYRYTNTPAPWQHYRDVTGRWPTRAALSRGDVYRVWLGYGGPVFGDAFKMFVGSENKGRTRLEWAVSLAEQWFGAHAAAEQFMDLLLLQPDSERTNALLNTIPRCASFMAMQILTDFGYSEHFQDCEDTFVVPGPGARRGALLYGPVVMDAIYDLQSKLTMTLPGTALRPSLIDTQNVFCEYQKYVRRADTRGRYRSKHHSVTYGIPNNWRDQ
jgi:hypothetical protein